MNVNTGLCSVFHSFKDSLLVHQINCARVLRTLGTLDPAFSFVQ